MPVKSAENYVERVALSAVREKLRDHWETCFKLRQQSEEFGTDVTSVWVEKKDLDDLIATIVEVGKLCTLTLEGRKTDAEIKKSNSQRKSRRGELGGIDWNNF
jgi:hypothetical protein